MLIVDVKIEISLFNDAWKEQKLNIIGLYTPLSIKLEIYKTHPIFNFLSYFECNIIEMIQSQLFILVR